MNEFNSTELFEDGNDFVEGSGEQERDVDSHESQNGGYEADGDGQGEAVDHQEEGGDEERSEEGENDPEVAGQGRAQRQTREDNSAARLARLHAERAADERIARSGILNPATGKPFQNMQELEKYGAAQREAEVQRIARQSGRREEDVREEMEGRDLLREMVQSRKAQQTAAKQAAAQQEFLVRDAQDFHKKHPDVDIGKLEQNKNFRRFCGSRFGVESLASLYEDYKAIVGGAESAGRAGAESRSRRSTGSGGTGGDMLTAHQRSALEQWNRDNPDMKMTAKEFLGK